MRTHLKPAEMEYKTRHVLYKVYIIYHNNISEFPCSTIALPCPHQLFLGCVMKCNLITSVRLLITVLWMFVRVMGGHNNNNMHVDVDVSHQ